MEWEMVVAIAVATPIILLPVAFVWYLNLAGLYAAVKEARKTRKGAKATA
jgi:hypothetical protein